MAKTEKKAKKLEKTVEKVVETAKPTKYGHEVKPIYDGKAKFGK